MNTEKAVETTQKSEREMNNEEEENYVDDNITHYKHNSLYMLRYTLSFSFDNILGRFILCKKNLFIQYIDCDEQYLNK